MNSSSGKGGKQNVDYEVKLEFYGEIDPEVCHILVFYSLTLVFMYEMLDYSLFAVLKVFLYVCVNFYECYFVLGFMFF